MTESISSAVSQANAGDSLRLLVTGANGFVGRALCSESVRRGIHIRAATRSASDLPADTNPVIVGAIDGGTDWTEALSGVDVIIHLGARVHVMNETAADPLAEFLKVNLHGTVNLARQAVQAGAKRLVYVSTIGVNGKRTFGGHTFSEADTPFPHNEYSVSKWQAEQELLKISQKTDLEIVIVRPPLVYGSAAQGNFQLLLAAIAKGIPLPLKGADNLRSLIYVGNLADALIACATHPSAAGQTYIVSDGEAVSTATLADKIAHALNRPNRSFYLPIGLLRAVAAMTGRSDQVDKLFGSLLVSDSKIRRELGWAPPYSLEQGLRATAERYIAQRAAVGFNRGSL